MRLKRHFPILKRRINGKEITYMDSAATTLKPLNVIEAVREFYEEFTSNVHRGLYSLSEEATERFEKAREIIAKFINASPEEIIFTKNTTESINLVAKSFPEMKVLTSILEHHSNLLPWILNHKVEFFDLNDDLTLNLNSLRGKAKNTDIISLSHISNVTGQMNPLEEIPKYNNLILIDAAQSIPHVKIDVNEINADFMAFSGHKMLGPSGTGILYVREEHLKKLKALSPGGGTLTHISGKEIYWQNPPLKFEGGTPNIEGFIGLGEAVRFLNKIGIKNVEKWDKNLVKYFYKRYEEFRDLLRMRIYGPENRIGIFSFNLEGIHSHDIASLLNEENIFIRAGNHCTSLLHKYMNISSSARASLYIYNDKKDIDKLFENLMKIREVFK